MSLGPAGAGPRDDRPGRPFAVLGGTFDPPHLAHLAIAEEAREALGLERVLFVPAGQPWQKSGRVVTPGSRRLAMVRAAVEGNPAFAADEREIERSGPTYTVETLTELAAGGRGRPWFILSSEDLAGLSTWRDPERILELARLCVAPRGPDPGGAVEAFLHLHPAAADLVLLDAPRLEISSTLIRARVRAGRSIRYLVPDGVAALIREYALYVGDRPPAGSPPTA